MSANWRCSAGWRACRCARKATRGRRSSSDASDDPRRRLDASSTGTPAPAADVAFAGCRVARGREPRRKPVCLISFRMRGLRVSTLLFTLASVVGAGCAAGRDTVSGIEDAPIVQPGAPGEPSRVITAGQAADVRRVQHTAADVRFTHNMLVHHTQALEMTALRAE